MRKMNKLLVFIIVFTMFSCGKTEPRNPSTPEEYKQMRADKGIETINYYDIEEFDYKGHTYLYNEVRDGIAMCHAGHCKCNKK